MNSSSPVYPFERTPALLVDLSFFRRADKKERRSVLGGKAVTGARGVSLEGLFLVKSIFAFFLPETSEIVRFYAMFSPVRANGPHTIQQPLVFCFCFDNYRLCFGCPSTPVFNSTHF